MSRYRYLCVEGVGHGVGRRIESRTLAVGVGELWVDVEESEGGLAVDGSSV